MRKVCHGCGGKGWVDSQYKGAVVCPVCSGTGESDRTEVGTGEMSRPGGGGLPIIKIEDFSRSPNKNPLLGEFEDWIIRQQGADFDHSNKTMNTYRFTSKAGRRQRGLAWVSNYGAGRIYLCKGDYSPVDEARRVKYEGVWGGYPQFEVRTPEDVEYAKRLVMYALMNF